LRRIIVDCAIEDTDGRTFWKKYFLEKEVVLWSEFAERFRSFVGILPDEQDSLSSLLATQSELFEETNIPGGFARMKDLFAEKKDNDEVVVIHKFSDTLLRFGPFGSKTNDTKIIPFFKRILSLTSKPWYHGDITTAATNSLLGNEAEGTFLVRFSSTPGCFAISRRTSKKSVEHYKVLHTQGSPFKLELKNSISYNSLEDLVEKEKNIIHLGDACPGSKYANPIAPIEVYIRNQ